MILITCIKPRRECGLSKPGAVERQYVPVPFRTTTSALTFLADAVRDHGEHAHELRRGNGQACR